MQLSAKALKDLFHTEEKLCQLFAAEMEGMGWTVYPETGGFDLLLVWEPTGHQLGVEAKLSLNAKVADQIVPDDYPVVSMAGESKLYDHTPPGPDFRGIIVPCLTDSSKGIAKMLKILGINVWDVTNSGSGPSFVPAVTRFTRQSQWVEQTPRPPQFDCAWFDFNPAQRCPLPEIKPTVRAGIPAPLQLSPWKIGALKVLADLELDGFVTARSVRAYGIDARRFCSTDGWLVALGDGKWGPGSVPRFDQQHPEAYAELLAQAKAKRAA